MRKMKKRISLVMGIILAVSSSGTTFAANLVHASIQPKAEVVMQQCQEEEYETKIIQSMPQGEGAQTFAWTDEEGNRVDLYGEKGEEPAVFGFRRSVIPSQYDLRDYEKVTSVKNQGKEGACWAFSAIGALESNILMQGSGDYESILDDAGIPDGSERHLAYFTKNQDINGDIISYSGDDVFSSGGNWNFAISTLSRGAGIEREDHVEYQDANGETLPVDKEHEYHRYANVKNAICYTDHNDVKQAIMETGAVASSYYSSGNYYYFKEPEKMGVAFFHSNSEEEQSGNHAILIVGWDDDYPKENFSKSTGL